MEELEFVIWEIHYPKDNKGQIDINNFIFKELLNIKLDKNIKSKTKLKNMVKTFINKDFGAPKTYYKKEVYHGIHTLPYGKYYRSKNTVHYDIWYHNEEEFVNVFYRIQRVKGTLNIGI